MGKTVRRMAVGGSRFWDELGRMGLEREEDAGGHDTGKWAES